jgi:anti-sigma regulatory factor (Ser/Thr protein kinase)
MRKPRDKTLRIQEFIIENIEEHPRDITSFAAENFGVSRNAILRHINKLVNERVISAHGSTRDRQYELNPIAKETFSIQISPDVEEDQIWRHVIRPTLKKLPDNVLHICEYGLSEMINNVIDHSEGNKMTININQYAHKLSFVVMDDGVGIFNKIQRDFELNDPRHAILELAKGKLTTDPERHSGEGIFFTSRMFDRFIIVSEGLFFSHKEPGDDWLLEHDLDVMGTSVLMTINPKSNRVIQEVFDMYASEDQGFGFTKTHVPLSLVTYGDENLISRSQARRLLARFRNFKEVLLDFSGVETVGQAFADEIFRVYARNYPEVDIVAINTNPQIDKMTLRAQEKDNSS